MPIAPKKKALALRVALGLTALLGLLACDRLSDNISRAVVTIAASAIIVLLWNHLHADRPFAERRRLFAITPRLSDVGKGVVIVLLSFPWVILCGLAVRYRILRDSADTALIVFVPAGVFLLTGMVLIGRDFYRAYHGS